MDVSLEKDNWKKRQLDWRLLLVMARVKQRDFAIEHKFDEAMLSQWLNGKVRANDESQEKMIKALEGLHDGNN